jgi:hypothetical protein
MTEEEIYHQLSCYTLQHPDPSFIHQHAVDAYAAQHVDGGTKAISIVFALVGLYLYLEKGFSGKQVQKAHMQLAKRRKNWVRPQLPKERGAVSVSDVVSAPPGKQRDALIREWCLSVWNAWREDRGQIVALVRAELGIA